MIYALFVLHDLQNEQLSFILKPKYNRQKAKPVYKQHQSHMTSTSHH